MTDPLKPLMDEQTAWEPPPPDVASVRQRARALRRRRSALTGAALVSSLIVGIAFVTQVARDPNPSPSSASSIPTSAMVECTSAGAQVSTPKVQPQTDGVHLRVSSAVGDQHIYIRRADDPAVNMGTGVKGVRLTGTDIAIPFGPGHLLVGCFDRGVSPPYSDASDAFDDLEVMDSGRIWVDLQLSCGVGADAGVVASLAANSEGWSPEKTIRTSVPGIRRTDAIRRGGYPDGPGTPLGDPFMILRDGVSVARVTLIAGGESPNRHRNMQLQVCRGSRVGEGRDEGRSDRCPVGIEGKGAEVSEYYPPKPYFEAFNLWRTSVRGGCLIVVAGQQRTRQPDGPHHKAIQYAPDGALRVVGDERHRLVRNTTPLPRPIRIVDSQGHGYRSTLTLQSLADCSLIQLNVQTGSFGPVPGGSAASGAYDWKPC
jgi:hypothetical protein